mmetsp:Transcript_28512/g.90874  ORF Transcript_28512/g.90874 Transcript_28512/m.90874 type:complete len:294 (+) Transcript_28512:3291-4172(+)
MAVIRAAWRPMPFIDPSSLSFPFMDPSSSPLASPFVGRSERDARCLWRPAALLRLPELASKFRRFSREFACESAVSSAFLHSLRASSTRFFSASKSFCDLASSRSLLSATLTRWSCSFTFSSNSRCLSRIRSRSLVSSLSFSASRARRSSLRLASISSCSIFFCHAPGPSKPRNESVSRTTIARALHTSSSLAFCSTACEMAAMIWSGRAHSIASFKATSARRVESRVTAPPSRSTRDRRWSDWTLGLTRLMTMIFFTTERRLMRLFWAPVCGTTGLSFAMRISSCSVFLPMR